MYLHRFDDEAAMRALDRKCPDPKSVVSKRTVRHLSAESLECKEVFLGNSCIDGLGNLVRCALEAQVSPNTRVEDGDDGERSPVVVLAAYYGGIPALKALLASGSNKELADTSGKTALSWAAQNGHLSCVQLLLDAGANANTQDSLGNTPLIGSVMSKHAECARALLPASDLAVTNLAGDTALHTAVTTASEACFELLLPVCNLDARSAPGVDPRTGEAVSDFNRTALHWACERGLLPMCKALLNNRADRMARDSRHFSPLHYAANYGHLSCAVVLVGRLGKVRMTPAEVDAGDFQGATALHLAAQNGFDQICGVLLGAGASLDAMTSGGATPLVVALYHHPTNSALLSLLSGEALAQLPGMVCDHCGLTAEQASVSLKDCGKCYAVRYCGKQCQLAAWPGHKEACKARVEEREERTRVKTAT